MSWLTSGTAASFARKGMLSIGFSLTNTVRTAACATRTFSAVFQHPGELSPARAKLVSVMEAYRKAQYVDRRAYIHSTGKEVAPMLTLLYDCFASSSQLWSDALLKFHQADGRGD